MFKNKVEEKYKVMSSGLKWTKSYASDSAWDGDFKDGDPDEPEILSYNAVQGDYEAAVESLTTGGWSLTILPKDGPFKPVLETKGADPEPLKKQAEEWFQNN